MSRLGWVGLGFLGGIIASICFLLVIQLWILSPTRNLAKVTGLDLPNGVSLDWYEDRRDTFFGQGSTLQGFKAPVEFSKRILLNCPRGFRLGKFAQAGIPENDVHIDGNLPACIFNKETRNHQDKVIIIEGKIIYQQIDR